MYYNSSNKTVNWGWSAIGTGIADGEASRRRFTLTKSKNEKNETNKIVFWPALELELISGFFVCQVQNRRFRAWLQLLEPRFGLSLIFD